MTYGRSRIRGHVASAALVAMVVAALVISGCQQPGQVVSEQKDVLCPHCKVVTETTRIKGMNFTTQICPHCEKASEEVWLGSGHYVETGHVCPKCGALVETCKACSEAM